jgi:hypothetical protein
MEMHDIDGSSNISRIGYENGVMRVEFKNGTLYEAADVPSEAYQEWLTSPHEGSWGKHWHRHIKGQYEFKLVTTNE